MNLVKQGIPVYKLYGEKFAWPTLDFMHCESIPERSRLHVWEIARHRHADLAQLFYVRGGTAQLDIEGQIAHIETPSILIVPPMCVHGFRFSENVDGYVFTLALPMVERIQADLGANHPMWLHAERYAVGTDKAYIDTLCDTIHHEYKATAVARDMLLHALMNALMVWVSRQVLHQRSNTERPDRGQSHLAAFARLVEDHYMSHWPISRYADSLGITTTHLNTTCRRLLSCSALDILHQRVLLEAKRNLTYTALSIGQISDLLGFVEPAYFTRFFKRLAGATPSSFRGIDHL